MRILKKIIINILAFFPTARGFTGRQAKLWVRKLYRDFTDRNGYSMGQKLWAYRHGFMPQQVDVFGITRDNYKDFISEREYIYLRPLNGKYSKWVNDRVTVRNIFKPFKQNLPDVYYQFSERDMGLHIIPLDADKSKTGREDVLELIREKQIVILASAGGRKSVAIKAEGDMFVAGGTAFNDKEIFELIRAFSDVSLLREYVAPVLDFSGSIEEYPDVLRIIAFNEEGDMPEIGSAYFKISNGNIEREQELSSRRVNRALEKDDANDDIIEDEYNSIAAYVDLETGVYRHGQALTKDGVIKFEKHPVTGRELSGSIKCWNEIRQLVDRMCRFVPQLGLFGLDIVITEDGFKIIDFLNQPPYPRIKPFSKRISAYFALKYRQKKDSYSRPAVRLKRGFKTIKLKVRAAFARTFYPKGLVPYLSITWIRDVFIDLFTGKNVKPGDKLWAYRHGFLSYRLPQYNITKDNHLNYISDFEYKWLRHINGKYRHWMEDKITVKYIVSDFRECFPGYYYYISVKNGQNKIIPMMDCPENYGSTYEDIFRLVREKGVLALKPDEGSHGNGFYKFWYQDGKYYLNFDEATEQEVLDILQDVNNQYLVTEYIQMHSQLKAIYDGAVNTIRMIVFKKDGRTPELGNAYMRFGSKKTGAVDNMGAGGMFAQIDIETGHYHNAKVITDNLEIVSCPRHPDTDVLIEGILPNWEKTVDTVLKVAESIPQLEYFGFDLAITEDGIKFPEINRFPDYPKIEKYNPKTIDYLLYKLEMKKKKFGYYNKPCRKLIHLPKR